MQAFVPLASPSRRERLVEFPRHRLHIVRPDRPDRPEARRYVRMLRLPSRPTRGFHWPLRGRSDPVRAAAWFGTRHRQGHSFFSPRRITGPLFWKVRTSIQQAMESWSRIARSHIFDTVFDLAALAMVLPFDSSRFASAFSGSGFINRADGLRMSVFDGDNLLTAISK